MNMMAEDDKKVEKLGDQYLENVHDLVMEDSFQQQCEVEVIKVRDPEKQCTRSKVCCYTTLGLVAAIVIGWCIFWVWAVVTHDGVGKWIRFRGFA